MSIDKTDIERLARLAKLRPDAAEIERYRADLSGILELVAQLQAADTAGVAPLAHPLDITARLRPDTVSEEDQRDKFQRLAPQVEGGCYLAPKVIES